MVHAHKFKCDMRKPLTRPWRARVNAPRSPEANSAGDSFAWIRSLGLTIAALSGIGALYGYGVALGLGDVFGLGAGAWFNSAFELIALSGEGILGLIIAMNHPEIYWSDLWKISADYASWGAMTALSMCVIVLVFAITHKAIHGWFGIFVRWLFPRKYRELAFKDGVGRGASLIGLTVAAGAAGGLLLVPVLVIALLFCALMVGLVPFVGYTSGTIYANQSILTPAYCVGTPAARRIFRLRNSQRDEPLKPVAGAHCVEIIERPGSEPVRGRLILSRPSYVLVYQPFEDRVVLVQIKEGLTKMMSISKI